MPCHCLRPLPLPPTNKKPNFISFSLSRFRNVKTVEQHQSLSFNSEQPFYFSFVTFKCCVLVLTLNCFSCYAMSNFPQIKIDRVYFGHGGRVELTAHSGDVVTGRTYCHQSGVSGGEVSHVRKTRVRSFQQAGKVEVRREDGARWAWRHAYIVVGEHEFKL